MRHFHPFLLTLKRRLFTGTIILGLLLIASMARAQSRQPDYNPPHESTGNSDLLQKASIKPIDQKGVTKKKKVKKPYEPIQFNNISVKNTPYNSYTEKKKPAEADGPGALLLGILAEKTHHSQ